MRDLVNMILAEVDNRLEYLKNRVKLGLGKGVLHMVEDGGPCQTVQATFLIGETRDGMERPQDYGFTSHPLPGMQPFAGFFGGDRSNGFVIAMCDRQFRIELLKGEVAMYDDLGQKVHLTRTGVVVKTPLNATLEADQNVTIKAGKKLRLEAEDIETHATRSRSWDVGGFGERWTWTGGTAWEHKTWQTDAAISSVTLSITPPEGP
ncbi:phage baseplate assembly protein [Magnetospirillum fulvum]|uniref:Bacteriophage Mu Gp45 protein n=1 Tax=Magnetospirillum fulvum MGU-K5 TaxID=1316936 RepID=S9SB78_MAGFU|nr:phage baseplate assembly protein [Magnetospirillum fulvum]EPY01348.1 bacteriophage Mu Gp45 protein [Magnetospirillum fulvum MGU-K5]